MLSPTVLLTLSLGLSFFAKPARAHDGGAGDIEIDVDEGSTLGFEDEWAGEEHKRVPLPSYHYGAGIMVECLERDVDTGEHIQLEDKSLKYIPFPICNETGKPLELKYGVEEELNCTIPLITDPFFHLLEFYIHNDAPLTCRLPARPPPSIVIPSYKQPYVPLIFALAGTLQRSHLHISTHLNILLHSTPKHHVHKHDSGVIDSGAAYSTSPLSHVTGPKAETKKLIIGDRLPLMLSVRWFPSPRLPRENGVVEWNGLGGHVTGWMIWYCVVSFVAGGVVVGAWMINWEVPRRMKGWGARMARNGYGYGGANGKALGGATPLGYGLGGGGGGGVGGGKSGTGGAVGNGWGFVGGGGTGGYADGKRD